MTWHWQAATMNAYAREWAMGDEMLWSIFAVLLILWLFGFIGNFAGPMIHLVLVVAVVVIAFQLLSGRRGRAV